MHKQLLSILHIDSDPTSVKHTLKLLESNPLISTVDQVADSDQALLKIIKSSPDIVFMEYPVRGNAGDELIEFIKAKLAETVIILVSDSKIHAATAIRSGIFNYLLKPIDEIAIDKVLEKVLFERRINNIERLNQIIEQIPETLRIKLQTTKGYLLINPEELIYCRADGVYTELHLTNNRVDLSYVFLSKVEEILKPYNFMKISRSCIINMRYIRRIFRDNSTIILSVNGEEYEVKGSKQCVRILSKIEME